MSQDLIGLSKSVLWILRQKLIDKVFETVTVRYSDGVWECYLVLCDILLIPKRLVPHEKLEGYDSNGPPVTRHGKALFTFDNLGCQVRIVFISFSFDFNFLAFAIKLLGHCKVYDLYLAPLIQH